MKQFRHAIILTILAGCGTALAAGGDPGTPIRDTEPKDQTVEAAQAKIAARDWAGAGELLAKAIARSPQNADYHNLYAYALRKGPNPNLELVFRHYNEALRIDPKHRGAHEYLGEAYLMQGNLAKAREHLAQLDRLCTFGCEEYSMLKKAVAEFEQRQAKK
ncbi:MAG: tetratricopeptide repeat protein [Pseudomonadota bacterium]